MAKADLMPRVWIDDRERLPWEFPECETVRARLFAGDYSCEGLTDCVAIERKSLTDFTQSLTYGRERFEDEMQRLSTYRRALVVVEAHLDDVIAGVYRGRTKPRSLVGSVASIHARWSVPTVFLGSRQAAQFFARIWLQKTWKHCRNVDPEESLS
jgi:ERCC4-type nuclease